METNRIELVRGDITALKVDIIVNAANNGLTCGGGVDGAIHQKGGPAIAKACSIIRRGQGGCETGQAVLTTAGDLNAKHVIHTVGPMYEANMDEAMRNQLANCYTNSLKLAAQLGVSSIAFPNISTGVYGFPKSQAAEIAIGAVFRFLKSDKSLEKIIFVCFDQENYDLYHQRIS